MLTATMAFALMDLMVKQLLSSMHISLVIWWRYVVQTILTVALVIPSYRSLSLKSQKPKLQLLRGLCLICATISFFFGLHFMPLAETTAISFISPILTIILGSFVLKESTKPHHWAGSLLGFFGVLIVLRPGGQFFNAYALFPLLAAVCFTIYQLITKALSKIDSPLTTLLYTSLVGTCISTVPLPIFWVYPNNIQICLILSIGFFASVAHYLLILALQNANTSQLSPYNYPQIIWAVIFAAVFLGELPESVSLIGIGAIVAGGLIALKPRVTEE